MTNNQDQTGPDLAPGQDQEMSPNPEPEVSPDQEPEVSPNPDPETPELAKPSASIPSGLAFFIGLGIIFMLVFLMIELKFMLLPLVLAFFVCCLLNPLVAVFCGWHMPRPLAIVFTLALGLAVLWLAFNYAMASMTALFDGFPKYRGRIDGFVDSLAVIFGGKLKFLTPDFLTSQLSKLSLGPVFSNFFSSFFSLTGHMALTVILILYFLPGLPGLPDKLNKAFPGSRGKRLSEAVSKITNQVQRYILYKTLLCATQGLLVAGMCQLLGVDFPGSWGVMAFLSSFIPKLGVLFFVVPPSLICLIQYGWGRTIWLMIILSFIGFLYGNIIEPLFLGRSVDLSPTATFLSILVWGWLWGAAGMFLAVPLMAVVKLSCDNFPSFRPVGSLMAN